MSQVTAINIAMGVVVTDCQTVVEIDTYFDAEGEPTEDKALAVVAIAQLPDGNWAAVVLSDFDPAQHH